MAVDNGYNYIKNMLPMNYGNYYSGENYQAPPLALAPATVSTQGSSLTDPLSGLLQGTGLSGAIDPTAASTEAAISANPLAPPAAAGPEGFSFGNMLKGTLLNDKGGLNIGGITSLLGSIGGIYGAIKGFGLAKDQLDFQKTAFNTNLENSKKSYNTALEGDAHSRAAAEGRGKGWVDDYVNKNKL